MGIFHFLTLAREALPLLLRMCSVEPGLVNRALLLESSLYSANAVVSNTVVVDLLDPGEKAGCRHPAVFFSLSFTILALLLVRKYRALGSVRDCAVELAVRYVCAGREVPSGKMGITGGGRSAVWRASVEFLMYLRTRL